VPTLLRENEEQKSKFIRRCIVADFEKTLLAIAVGSLEEKVD
jgi:hypothetical protein